VLISVTDANLKTVANGGGVGKSDGTDIVFTASDGVTKLDHEIESYNASTGLFISWVRIPALSPTAETVIYAYYGNASASLACSAYSGRPKSLKLSEAAKGPPWGSVIRNLP